MVGQSPFKGGAWQIFFSVLAHLKKKKKKILFTRLITPAFYIGFLYNVKKNNEVQQTSSDSLPCRSLMLTSMHSVTLVTSSTKSRCDDTDRHTAVDAEAAQL